MFGYYTAYIIVVLCLFVSFFKNKKVNTVAFFVLCVILVCLCGFRHVGLVDGNDSYAYYYNFVRANQRNPVYFGAEYHDPVFLFLTKFIRFFTDNEYVYGFIVALLTIVPVLYLYKKVSPCPAFALFLYVCLQVGGSSPYFMAFNQMRQALAVGFMCIAIYHYIKNKYHLSITVLFWLIIMVLTHWSSVLIIVPFLLKNVRLSKSFYIIGMVAASVAGLFAARFVPQLSDLFILLEQGFFVDNDIEFSLIHNLPLLLLSCYVFVISSERECNSFEHKCLFLQFVLYGLMAPFNNSIFRFCIYYGVVANLAIASSFYRALKKRKTVSEGNMPVQKTVTVLNNAAKKNKKSRRKKTIKQKHVISFGVAATAFVYISYVILTSLAGLEKAFPYSIW